MVDKVLWGLKAIACIFGVIFVVFLCIGNVQAPDSKIDDLLLVEPVTDILLYDAFLENYTEPSSDYTDYASEELKKQVEAMRSSMNELLAY
jgi:hypothetical protein